MILAVLAIAVLATHQQAHGGHAAASQLLDTGAPAEHAHPAGAPAHTTPAPDIPGIPDYDPCHQGGVGESCLALLYIVGALFTFVLGRRRTAGVLRRWAASTPSWIGRTGDPPSLYRLSVLRC